MGLKIYNIEYTINIENGNLGNNYWFYFRRLYFHGAQFHTQQFASMHKLYDVTLLQNNISPAWRRQALITNYSFTSEQARKAVICAHNWPWNYDTKHTKHARTHTHTQTHMPTTVAFDSLTRGKDSYVRKDQTIRLLLHDKNNNNNNNNNNTKFI